MARQAHASARNDSCSLRRPVEQQLNSSKVSILSGHFDCSHTFIFRLLTLQSILVTIGRCAPAGLNYATRSKRCLCAGSRGSDGSAASHLSGFVSGGSVQESHSGQQGVCCSSHFDWLSPTRAAVSVAKRLHSFKRAFSNCRHYPVLLSLTLGPHPRLKRLIPKRR